jgi:RNA recognition motif-containing protein
MKKLYVGNLSWGTTDADLTEMFTQYGDVTSARVITDRETGRSRGFGFVELDDAGAEKAMKELDGQEFQGRNLRVNEAQEKPRRDGGGGRGPGGGGGGGRW